jgi:hypothetical protein
VRRQILDPAGSANDGLTGATLTCCSGEVTARSTRRDPRPRHRRIAKALNDHSNPLVGEDSNPHHYATYDMAERQMIISDKNQTTAAWLWVKPRVRD